MLGPRDHESCSVSEQRIIKDKKKERRCVARVASHTAHLDGLEGMLSCKRSGMKVVSNVKKADSCDLRETTFSINRKETGKQTERGKRSIVQQQATDVRKDGKGSLDSKAGKKAESANGTLFRSLVLFGQKGDAVWFHQPSLRTEQEPREEGTHMHSQTRDSRSNNELKRVENAKEGSFFSSSILLTT